MIKIKVCYFARLREQLGLAEEEITLPTASTVEQVLVLFQGRGQPWTEVFAPGQTVLTALNHVMTNKNAQLQAGDELAFFPPVTGG